MTQGLRCELGSAVGILNAKEKGPWIEALLIYYLDPFWHGNHESGNNIKPDYY